MGRTGWFSRGLLPAAVVVLVVGCASGHGGAIDPAGPSDASDEAADAGPDRPDECSSPCGIERVCCADSEACVEGACAARCETQLCGDPAVCCGASELCLRDACVEPGAACENYLDCGADERCDPAIERCVPIGDETCRYAPPPGVFDPVLEWEWSESSSLSMPVITQLTDDNADGATNGDDVPDVLIVVAGSADGAEHPQNRLVALSGDDGRELWESTEVRAPSFQMAAADVDRDGDVEIVTQVWGEGDFASLPAVGLLTHEGDLLWRTSALSGLQIGTSAEIADVDGDGFGEIFMRDSLFTHTGERLWQHTDLVAPGLSHAVIANVAGDDKLEVLGTNVARSYDGELLWSNDWVLGGSSAIAHFPEFAETDPGAHLVVVNATQFAILEADTGEPLLGPVVYATVDATRRAGTPTVGDFDGDGDPEVGVAGDQDYVVFDPDLPAPHILWSFDTEDGSTGSVGSTLFDFDADGSVELVLRNECHLQIRRGSDGELLWYTVSTSVTIDEYAVVADVDNDGNAEIIVTNQPLDTDGRCEGRSLPYSGERMAGVRVYGDRLDNWVATGNVWNEHGFHLTNIDPHDGSLPFPEQASWTEHNTYRVNRLPPELATLAPDLEIVELSADATGCPSSTALRAHVGNAGARGVLGGVSVAFYNADDDTLLAVARTSGPLIPGATEWVEATLDSPPWDSDSLLRVRAVIDDDGTGLGQHNECIEDNGVTLEVECIGPD